VQVPSRRAEAMHAARVTMLLLLVPTAVLTVLGLAMIMSAGSVSATQGYDGNPFWYAQRQGIYAIVGVAALLAAVRIPHVAWQKLALPLLVVLMPLMLIALHPSAGSSLYGASRWIDLGPVTLQPSEFMKFAVVVFTATILTRKWGKLDDPVHVLIPLAPVVLAVALLVILQRDLGTTVIICGSAFLLLFVAGVRLRYLTVTGLAALAGVAFLIFGEAYRRTRFVDSFLNPWEDPDGAGFQLIQGMIAFGSGGWTGVGLGASRQKWDYLPNAHSDFIFAIIGEELGLLGALFVLVMFAILLFAGVRIAVTAPDTFGRLVAAGITGWIGLQTVINLGAVTGLMPITGVPLPLLSFGGTALVVTLAGIGVLASVARASVASTSRAAASRPSAPAYRGAGVRSRGRGARQAAASGRTR
jgi:cell division protein FtsW